MITILGQQVNIAYNIATQIFFEDLTGIALTDANMNVTRNAMALYYAAIAVNNKDIDLSIDDLYYKASGDEIASLRVAVTEAVAEWSKIPGASDDEEGDDSKKD